MAAASHVLNPQAFLHILPNQVTAPPPPPPPPALYIPSMPLLTSTTANHGRYQRRRRLRLLFPAMARPPRGLHPPLAGKVWT